MTSPSPNCGGGGGGGGERVPAELQQQLRAPECRAQDAPAQAPGECRLGVGDPGGEGRGQARWRRGWAGEGGTPADISHDAGRLGFHP